ncbi:Yip1 family protein [Roseicyclus sp.]|uniref:Yip1 family protein n=1 Tax=Roseicyclus sp. TaxID=1914329 RepID=UPI003F6B1A87
MSADLMNLGHLLRLARETVSNPREGAATILDLGLSVPALRIAFALVVVLSMLLGELVVLVTPPPPEGALSLSPVTLGLVQAAFLFVIAHAITLIGRWFGGTGGFEGALSLLIWMQFIFLCVQVLQLLAIMILPPLAGLITILALGLFFWLLVNFIATLHGFTSLGMIFVMTILSAFGIIFGLSLILTLLGIGFGTL